MTPPRTTRDSRDRIVPLYRKGWPEALFNRFSVQIPPEAVRDCSGPGPADDAVAFHVDRQGIEWPAAALIREELAEYGAWTRAELRRMSAQELREILLWVAAGNIREGVTE